MKPGIPSSSRLNRNLIERNRRIQMKALYSRLADLLPSNSSKTLTVPQILDQSINYMKMLQARIEKLKLIKEKFAGENESCTGDKLTRAGSISSMIDIKNVGSTLEINLISGLGKNFILYEVFLILKEEGANVLSLTSHYAGDRVFHTIHSQEIIPRIGIDMSRVKERLMQLVSFS